MSRPWTAISYNWKVGKSHKIMFVSSADTELARKQFESEYPCEDLVALIPGTHEWTTTYPLTNFMSAIKPENN